MVLQKATTSALQGLTTSLRTVNITHLFIGKITGDGEFFVQNAILDDISTSLSVYMFVYRETSATGARILRLEGSDITAWKVLLHWKIKGRLPPLTPKDGADPDPHVQLLCHCWMLGETWDIPTFQDLIMLELLRVLKLCAPSLTALKLVFEKSKPNSKLCELMGEEIAYVLKHRDEDRDLNEALVEWGVKDIENIVGLRESMNAVLRGFCGVGDEGIRGRLEDAKVWRTYMVGEGPHWICGEGEEEG